MSHAAAAGRRLFLLGAYHGINPGMGWLFAVALRDAGAQLRGRCCGRWCPSRWDTLLPSAWWSLLAELIQIVLPLSYVKFVVAGVAGVALGVYRIIRSRAFRTGAACRWDFWELTAWSFLMATAHGAGLMVLPVVMQMAPRWHITCTERR